VLILPQVNYPTGAEIVARKLISQIAIPMQVHGHEIALTVSIGISGFPTDGPDAALLLKQAGAAMYRAKRAGRNGYVIDTANAE
jgi:diguanylate cyclase (GGDEF)-like protein